MSTAAPSFASCCAELYELPIVEYLLGRSFHPGGAKLSRELASATLVAPSSTVLDIACGVGNSARILAADCGASVVGCDFSASNLARAAITSITAGLSEKTLFVQGDAQRLPFAEKSFDVALCECSLCLFDDMDAALKGTRRALKPGGRIGISDFYVDAPIPSRLDGLLGRVLCVAAAPSMEGYRDALFRSGFEHVRIRRVNWALADMIGRIRHRLSLLASGAARIEMPADWDDPLPTLAELDRFISGGGGGYLIATARRPVGNR